MFLILSTDSLYFDKDNQKKRLDSGRTKQAVKDTDIPNFCTSLKR